MSAPTPQIRIDGRNVGPGHPAFIIAEVGINHDGDETVAARMIDAAADAGADAVKFQTVDVAESYMPGTASHEAFLGKDLSLDALRRLVAQARSRGIVLFSTPGDAKSLAKMVAAGMPAVKISSGLMTNLPLVAAAAETGLPLVISTGMAHLDEVREATEAARKAGGTEMVILQCTSLYPAPADTLNLSAMAALAEATGCPIGYSDHFDGPLACLAAIALGACMIEKHFTFDRSQPGADHHISANPEEFAALVRDIRTVEAMRGNGIKGPTSSELGLRDGRHRVLVSRDAIAAGTVLTPALFRLMRPLPGTDALPAKELHVICGRHAKRSIAAGTPVTAADIEGAL
ncbi:MAG: N-acetylneuraminate synthase family protein [Alphaproteobacteria bacterium]